MSALLTDPCVAVEVLHIRGDMTIYRAAELKQELLEGLDLPGEHQLDLSDVNEIDSAGVQLLLLAARSARLAGGTLRLLAPSAAVCEVLASLGLSPDAQGHMPHATRVAP